MCAAGKAVIDRIGPTRRPQRTPVSYQQWRSLAFLHWPVSTEVLRPLVPTSLEIDSYDGTAYVGLVPFAMQQVRMRGTPSLLGLDFLETNVRTYVTYNGRPGVYFFSLDAASRLAVWTARTIWGLPYYFADMSLEREDDAIAYRAKRTGDGHASEVRCVPGENLPPAPPDSIEFFFLERYLLYVQRRRGMYVGQVYHQAYPVRQATITQCDDQLVAAAGCTGCPGPPSHAHFSQGVDVEICALQPAGH